MGHHDSKKIKENLKKQLKNLQQKRDKMSIAKRWLLLETQGWQLEPQQCSPYKRIKWNPSTLAVHGGSVRISAMQAVCFEGDWNAEVLPKRMKRLHRDFLAVNGQKLSLRSVYRHRPKHIKASKHQAFRLC